MSGSESGDKGRKNNIPIIVFLVFLVYVGLCWFMLVGWKNGTVDSLVV